MNKSNDELETNSNYDVLGYATDFVELVTNASMIKLITIAPIKLSFNKFSRCCRLHVQDELTLRAFCSVTGRNCRKDDCVRFVVALKRQLSANDATTITANRMLGR